MSNKIEVLYPITIDLVERNLDIPIVKEYDTYSRYLDITITSRGQVVDITDYTPRVYVVKPDATLVFNNCTVTDATTGRIKVELTNQILAVDGKAYMEITLYGASDEIVSSRRFTLKIEDTLRDDSAIESTNEFTAFTQSLATVQTAVNEAKQAVIDAQELMTKTQMVVNTYSYVSSADATRIIPINVSYYNPTTDVLEIHYKGLLLEEGNDYTRNNNIVTLNFDLDTTDHFVYKVCKFITNSSPVTGDGSLINNGTIPKEKMVASVQLTLDSVGSAFNLNTSDQSSIVNAINEVNDKVGDLPSLTTTSKTNAVAAINDVQSQLQDVAINVRSYKTTLNTWQDAIQLALNVAESNGGGKVLLPPGITVSLNKVGYKTCSYGFAEFSQYYCLEIGDNVDLDLNGSTLLLANGQNATIIVNKNVLYSSAENKRITIQNGVIDSNCLNQTNPTTGNLDGILIINCTELKLDNLRFDNCRDTAFRIMKVDNSVFDNLLCTYSDGDGFRFGPYITSGTFDQTVSNSIIGSLQADNCMINKNGTLQGNPIIASLKNTTIGQIRSFGCGGGYKFQDGCENLTIGRLLFNGATTKDTYNASANSGTKIQGGSGKNPSNITIGEVMSTDCGGYGLYLEACTNVNISSYIGKNNSQLGNYSDVRVGTSSRTNITNILSELAGSVGVEIRSDATDYTFGDITVLNCGVSTSSVGVLNSGTNGHINSVMTKDDRATKKMTYGFSVPVTSVSGTLDYFENSGYATLPFKFESSNYEIKKVVLDNTVPTYGQVTLTASATSTTITNVNIKAFNRGANGYNVPIITLIPVNTSARTLLTKPLSYTVSTTSGFTINHNSAVGGELFIWRVDGYILAPNNFA